MRQLQILAVFLNGLVLITSSPLPTASTQFTPSSSPYFQSQRRIAEPQVAASNTYPQVAPQKRQSGYGYPQPTPTSSVSIGASAGVSGGSELDTAAQNFGDGSFARPTQPGGFGGIGGGSGGGGGGGGGFGRPSPGGNVRCQRISAGGDSYRFQCEVIRKEAITLKYEHILWLASGGVGAKPVEIIVPNYRVEEIIKAGFKDGPQGGKQPINILLQRPEKTVAAEVDVSPTGSIEPEVNIQYEPPTNTQVHYPNDQAYRPLSGPILPPSRN